MADRRTPPDDELEHPDEERERGIGDDEEEFEDTDDLDEDEEEGEDEDLDSPRGTAKEHDYTAEIGSEGGSQGDMEVERPLPRVTRGSEATTTATTARERGFDDRQAGGGLPRPR